MFRRSLLALTAVAVLGISSYVALAQGRGDAANRKKAEAAYPLDTCPVMNVKLTSKGQPVTKQFDGRTVKLCCTRCVGTFEKDKEKYHAKMDQMIIRTTRSKYPLKECVVSGEALGGMGEPVDYVHRPTNQLVRFCCAGCVDGFKADPAPFLAKIDAAGAAKPGEDKGQGSGEQN